MIAATLALGQIHGYPVTVIWDDPTRRETTVMHWALSEVSSPDVCPYIFWDKQWQPLKEQWLKARREVEQLVFLAICGPTVQLLEDVETEGVDRFWWYLPPFACAART